MGFGANCTNGALTFLPGLCYNVADTGNCVTANPTPRRKEGVFVTRTIEIKNKDQLERINRLASQAPYPVWLSMGNLRLDARSLLGLFAFIGKRAQLVAGDGVDPDQFEDLVARMGY